MKNEFVEIAASKGKYFANNIYLDFILWANENPKIRKIYKLTIYPSMVENQHLVCTEEYKDLLKYLQIPSNRDHLCANIHSVNNIIRSFVKIDDLNNIKFEINEDGYIVGNCY